MDAAASKATRGSEEADEVEEDLTVDLDDKEEDARERAEFVFVLSFDILDLLGGEVFDA